MSARAVGARVTDWFARLSIRWRLALTSAGLTFAILLVFAIVVGVFTANRLEADFDDDLEATAAELEQRIPVSDPVLGSPKISPSGVVAAIVDVAATGDAAMRIVDLDGDVLAPLGATPDLGPPRPGVTEFGDYRVVSRPLAARGSPSPVGFLQYGREQASLSSTVARMNLFLALGVAGGTVLALLAGLAVARRAMRPIADLTHAAQGIARTRDSTARIPEPQAEDEVADLARTLEEMLRALDSARREIETTLAREREFVADASHELRTPLTSLLANLELLEAELRGDDREIASAALRSTQRMRRLVGDLLFLARADSRGPRPPTMVVATDLSAVARDVVAETAPLAASHQVSLVAPSPAVVEGSPDDLHRLVLNLVQNAVAHTPAGTRVEVTVRVEAAPEPVTGGDAGGQPDLAVLEVSDDGPGVPADVRQRVFDRFVRGGGDGGGASARGGRGSGLGLAIVRAVAEAHGGHVTLGESPGGGAKFELRLPSGAKSGPRGRRRSSRRRCLQGTVDR